MPPDYDPEDWRSTPACPVHYSPLSPDGSCLHCRSLEAAFKSAREITQPIYPIDEQDDEEDYEQP
jgi:hypothetical protein